MKKQNQLQKTIFEVSDVWQILIDQKVVDQIENAAAKRKVSMSWIVRYCVFRFISLRGLRWNKSMSRLFYKTNPKLIKKIQKLEVKIGKREEIENIEYHRFQLALYGKDVFVLKNVAAYLEMSVSDVVRIALYLYLKKLDNLEKVSQQELYWYGIKIIENIVPHRYSFLHKNVSLFWEYIPYSKISYSYMVGGPIGRFFSIAGMIKHTYYRVMETWGPPRSNFI